MKNSRFRLGIVFFAISSPVYATEVQLWTNYSIHTKPHKKAKFSFNQEMRYFDDASNLSYMHFEPAALFAPYKSHSFGVEPRVILNKDSDFAWIFEGRPTIVAHNKLIKADKFTVHSRMRFYLRMLRNKANRGAFRARLGLDFFKTRVGKFYATQEIFYHHNKLHQIDRYRTSFGFKFKIINSIRGSIYYLRQEEKKVKGGGWRGFNVLGATISTYF